MKSALDQKRKEWNKPYNKIRRELNKEIKDKSINIIPLDPDEIEINNIMFNKDYKSKISKELSKYMDLIRKRKRHIIMNLPKLYGILNKGKK